MILFSNLPDEISAHIDKYVQFDNYKVQFNDIMNELKNPKLPNGKNYMRSNWLFFTLYFNHLYNTCNYCVDYRYLLPQINWTKYTMSSLDPDYGLISYSSMFN